MMGLVGSGADLPRQFIAPERVLRLETSKEVWLPGTSRWGVAHPGVASQHVSDLARLLGGLDERVKRLEAGAAGSRALLLPEA